MTTAILNNLDTVAVIAGGIFAGTALYVSFSEVAALREFGLNEHWKFFPHMYKHAAFQQAVSATVAGVAAVVHGTRIEGAPFYRNLWFAGGSAFLAMFPITMILIAPTNRQIIDDNKNTQLGNESQINTVTRKELLDKWACLHMARTVVSVAGFCAMVYGLKNHSSLVLAW